VKFQLKFKQVNAALLYVHS